jgi:hypothetical protein
MSVVPQADSNLISFFAVSHMNQALALYRVSVLINQLYGQVLEARTILPSLGELGKSVYHYAITYPDTPLHFLVKFPEIDVDLFGDIMEFY